MDSKDLRGSLYGLGFCATSLFLLAEMPLVLTWLGLMVAIPATVGLIRQICSLSKCESPGAVVADGMGLILNDVQLGQPTHDIDEKDVSKGVTKVAQITRIPFSKASDTKWWVKGKHVIDTSWVVIGPRGSGKSLSMRWMAREALKANADVYWFDWHWSPDGAQHIDVLPGMDPDRYVMESKDRQIATLKYLIKLGQERLTGKHGKSFKPIVIFWDEFQDLTNAVMGFSSKEQAWVNDAVRMIQDGFRKAKIQIVLSLKSIKKEQSGLDMSTLLQCNWLFTGGNGKNFSALEDKNATFPDEISDNRQGLVAQAKALKNQEAGTQGAVCLIDGESAVKCHPDCAALVNMLKAHQGFDVEGFESDDIKETATTFFHPHMAQIEAAIVNGDSRSTVFNSIPGHGEKSDKNPKWVQFGEIYESIKQRLSEVTQ